METKNFSQRVLNVVKYFWKQRSGYGAILLVLFAFCISALFLPADSSVVENVFQTVGSIGLFSFLFGAVASGMTFFLELLLKGVYFTIKRLFH